MPNKYSHALVLSHYESRGLINHDQPYPSRTCTTKSVKPTDRSSRPSQAANLPGTTSQRQLPRRIRIDYPDDTSPYLLPPPLLRNSSSTETQIYAPKHLATPAPTRDHQAVSNSATRHLSPHNTSPSIREEGEEKIRTSIETQVFDPQPLRLASSQADRQSESRTQKHASQASSFGGSDPGSNDNGTRIYSTRHSPSPTSCTNWQSSSEVKARRRAAQAPSPQGSRSVCRENWPRRSGRNTPQSPPLTVAPHQNTENKFEPISSRPPSPPATPDSGKSFGLETHLDRLDKTRSATVVIPETRHCLHLKPDMDRSVNGSLQAAAMPDSGHSSGRDIQLDRPAGEKSSPPVPDRSPHRTPLKSSPSSQRSRSPVLRSDQDNMIPQTAKPARSHFPSMSTNSSVRYAARSSSLRFESEPTRPNTSRSAQTTFSITTQSSTRLSATAPTSPPLSEPTASQISKTSKSLHFPNFSVSTQSSYGYSPTSPELQFHHEPPRPRTSNGHRSPTFSLPTRTSSLSATVFPPALSRTSSMPSRALVDDDADLESLPSTILDLDVIPWENTKPAPAIFRHVPPGEERSMSSRSSSFDSAAPPPIRRAPKSLPPEDKPLPRSARLSSLASTPKKSRKRLSSMLFSRPQVPTKSIPYSETVPGNKPIVTTVSTQSAPSIPALFPTYRGPFPPPQKSEEHVHKVVSQTYTEDRTRRTRRVSQGAAEKRRSWFRNEQIDRAFGVREPVKQKAIEEIFKANLYV